VNVASATGSHRALIHCRLGDLLFAPSSRLKHFATATVAARVFHISTRGSSKSRNVRYWPKADIPYVAFGVAFAVKRTCLFALHCQLLTHSGHRGLVKRVGTLLELMISRTKFLT